MSSNKYPMKRDRDWSSADWDDLGPDPVPSTPNPLPASPLPEMVVKVNEDNQQLESYIDDNRINFTIAPGDSLRECPYQKSHLILEQRWIRHLCKCRSNYLKECGAKNIPITIGICKWNNAHHLHIRDLGRHELVCTHRIIKVPDAAGDEVTVCFNIDRNSTKDKNVTKSGEVEEGQVGSDTTDDEAEAYSENLRKRRKVKPKRLDTKQEENMPLEDWEVGLPVVPLGQPAHNPSRAILKQNIPFIKIPSGLTKRERGTFRVLQTARVRKRANSEAERDDCQAR